MSNRVKFGLAKFVGKLGISLAKFSPGDGNSFPGLLFLRFGGMDSLKILSKELDMGSILITGTNGKTTTTTLLIRLFSSDIDIKQSYESNTVNAITTSMLRDSGDLGVFEYGIRDIAHGIPSQVQEAVNPIGVVYTTISREHTQVLGVKNSFKDYMKAKALLSDKMKEGIIVVNTDDPRTAAIGLDKEKDVHINYYGIENNLLTDKFGQTTVKCPICDEKLEYEHVYMNHRGIYHCSNCGFKRPSPNVALTNLDLNKDYWILEIKGDLYNYTVSKNISFKLNLKVPPFGYHNIYNTLCSITAYASFTPTPEKIESTSNKVFNNLEMSFIPPGRFEVIEIDDKIIGIGQGDNGDALKINISYMDQYIDSDLEFIYTAPDENEEEIFHDHLESIRAINPEHLIVVPGRKSVEIAEKYYNEIKDEFNSDFIPINTDLDKKISQLEELIRNSKYNNIIISGCGEEQLMWEPIKKKLAKK